MTRELTSFCRRLAWDSEFFAQSIGECRQVPGDTGCMATALAWATQENLDCLYVLTESSDSSGVRAIEDAGGRLMDIRVTLERKLEGEKFAVDPRVRASRASDVSALRTLAARSHTASRFYADRRFSRASCDELYATWIEKSCRGWASQVLVAVSNQGPVGYLSCHLRDGSEAEIGLVAVAEQAQGQGLGRALCEAGLAYFVENSVSRVRVVTQGRSLTAQRLYQNHGFRAASLSLWHHLWL